MQYKDVLSQRYNTNIRIHEIQLKILALTKYNTNILTHKNKTNFAYTKMQYKRFKLKKYTTQVCSHKSTMQRFIDTTRIIYTQVDTKFPLTNETQEALVGLCLHLM